MKLEEGGEGDWIKPTAPFFLWNAANWPHTPSITLLSQTNWLGHGLGWMNNIHPTQLIPALKCCYLLSTKLQRTRQGSPVITDPPPTSFSTLHCHIVVIIFFFLNIYIYLFSSSSLNFFFSLVHRTLSIFCQKHALNDEKLFLCLNEMSSRPM